MPSFSGSEKLSFNHPELHRINTQRNQRCCDLLRWWDDVLFYGATKEQCVKIMLAVKSRLREKNFTNNEKKINSKPVDSVLLGYFISKKGIAPDSKHVKNIKKQKHQITANH